MPEHVSVAELDPGIVALVDQIRANHPGLMVGVQSPTVEERDDLDVTGDHREIVIGPVGPESYVIPLHDNDADRVRSVAGRCGRHAGRG